MNVTYLMPICTALLIVLFYAFLPSLKHCKTPLKVKDSGRGHWFIVLLTLCYGFVAFFQLGDTVAPQTVYSPSEGEVVLTLPEPGAVSRIMLYSGIGQGSYHFEFSPDGETWTDALDFDQNHAAVLKWDELKLEDAPTERVAAIRISGTGAAEIGEIAVYGPNGLPLSLQSTAPELCDEPDTVPDEPFYLNSSYFDEIYHARTAWEHLRNIYPYEISHPPLGKLILSVGIALFGMTPFGWRFSGTLLGVLMIPLVYWFARRLFGGKEIPGCCAALLATDFMHFTHTRIATIDTYAVFFILLMYGFMYLFIDTNKWRYLALSGLFFALGAASKWTCFYAGAGLALLWLWYWVDRIVTEQEEIEKAKKLKKQGPKTGTALRALLKNIGFCLVFFVALPVLAYFLAYLPYASARGVKVFSSDYLKLIWDNQRYMYGYHSGVNSTHPYSSRWYQWMLDIRPILYYLKYFDGGMRSSFGAWVNPVLCWAGLLSVFVLVYMALARRDKKAIFLLIAYLAQLLPWVPVTRITFEYHYFPCAALLTLCMGYVFSLMRDNKKDYRFPVRALTALSLVLFILFYPALSGLPVPNSIGKLLRWLPTWPF